MSRYNNGDKSKLFSKIRKFAKENNLHVKEWDNFETIDIVVNGLNFEISNRDSTMYRSGRTGTMKGNPKGLYMSVGNGYSYQIPSQSYAIEEMRKRL